MLTSLQNPLVKQARKLHQSKGRKNQQLLLLEGTHLLEEAFANSYPLETVFCTDRWQEKHRQLWEDLSQHAARVELVSPKVLEAIATTVNPDGAIATAPQKAKDSPIVTSLGLALETIQDPGNLGTIIRTATATDTEGLLLSSDSADLDHPKVLRASAGAWFKLPMGVTVDLAGQLNRYRQQGMQVVAAVPNAQLSYWEINLREPTIILLGNEGTGLSEKAIALADKKISIPLSRGIESLNVAISAALILYEAQRQRLCQL
ncbi:MAG: RNA methyltransferase [Okeania sp. SIO2H7]|nr:RNA methyltransferase [Okeania sp. SIO2H7]